MDFLCRLLSFLKYKNLSEVICMNSAVATRMSSFVKFGVGLAETLNISVVGFLLQLLEAGTNMSDFPHVQIGEFGACEISGRKDEYQRVIKLSFKTGNVQAEAIELRFDFHEGGYEIRSLKHFGCNGQVGAAFKTLADNTGVTMHFCG